jgi:hypothetical protein
VARFAGERKVKPLSCLDQFLGMAFARLTFRESLRDIEAWLRAQRSKLYYRGIRSTSARNTVANANGVRDWRVDIAADHRSIYGLARTIHEASPATANTPQRQTWSCFPHGQACGLVPRDLKMLLQVR